MALPKTMKVTPSELIWWIINVYFPNRLPVIIWGDGGLGKTMIAKQIAQMLNMEMYPWHLMYYDLTDLKGFPMLRGERSGWAPPDWFPDENKALIHFWDEINRVAAMIGNACFEAFNENRIGASKFHPDSFHIGTANFEGIGVTKMSENMHNRTGHFELIACIPDWIKWGDENKIHPTITAYHKWRGLVNGGTQDLHNTKVIQDKAWPSPRSWARASIIVDQLEKLQETSHDRWLTGMASQVGEDQANQYIGFRELRNKLPDPAEIVRNPKTAPLPDAHREIGAIYAIQGLLATIANPQNMDPIMEYATRMPPDNTAAIVYAATGRNPDLIYCKSITHFKRENPGYFVDVA